MAVQTDPVLSPQVMPPFERACRAVLAADVVGYTRLMEAAELETHQRYRTLRVEVTDPTIVSHRGEIVKNTGDGFLAVFESPLDAVECATELQQEILTRESQYSPERRIAFRIGIHWEPVIFDLDDVYGSAVNIAARLQTTAPAGGIVVSSAVLDNLDGLGGLKLDSLGDLRLKNLTRAVPAFSLQLPGVERGAAVGFARSPSKRAKLPSIAVLPLVSLSDGADDNYFAEGFVDDIIATLSNIRHLLVVARGSTMMIDRRAVDYGMVAGERLGVRYLLSGSIRRAGGRIRLSVELGDLSTASIIWAEKYETDIEHIFGVQDEIALMIVGRISTHVRQAEVKRALRKRPHNLNSYDHFLRALDLLYKLDFASFSMARTLLERAREEDDGYAAPYAFSARWHMLNIAEGRSTDPNAEIAEIIRLSNCAIERDPSDALALSLQGHARSAFYFDYDTALDCFDRALAASPNNPWAWMFSSATYGFIGKAASGIERAERAIRLSPLDQQAFTSFSRLGQNHYLNGTYEEAIRWSRKALSLNPRYGNAIRIAAASLVAVGRHEDAALLATHHRSVLPQFTVSHYAPRCPFKAEQASLYVQRLEAAGLPV
ncbi:adenylate/guanylate cyclase domain-containing protein [Bradyrhizobium tropiciagri]|uniref:adenylate/guanylate cyclase domain-containing protein n=1 Tax=Bradyrhizobium tropiciagri TaxID=312253 RepID=UPI001BABC426|nr:adenylate/guanylate cyclase domain-containing protein [Bradyrhizobium tropiciagri]MBR0894562.1 adenylate/guanylate cyclase domain-containing protein [Bradyrhizobium tropiciagri]